MESQSAAQEKTRHVRTKERMRHQTKQAKKVFEGKEEPARRKFAVGAANGQSSKDRQPGVLTTSGASKFLK